MYEEIYDDNKRLVTALARRYARLCELDRAVSMEDLVQSGFIGLARAADTYDPAAGKTWAAWAAWHIQRELRRALGLWHGRFCRPHSGAIELDRRIPTEDDGGDTLLDLLADDRLPAADAALLTEELRREVRSAVERLENDDQRNVTRLCRLEGRSYQEAADQLGLSVARARRLWERAANRLAGDRRLRALMDLDERTRFHAHKGVAAFNRDWTSVTEAAALWRIDQQRRSSGTYAGK